jgi:hypothetical protein
MTLNRMITPGHCHASTPLNQTNHWTTWISSYPLTSVKSNKRIMNVTYGIMTGVGTIDRLKKKASNTVLESDEEPIPLKDIFGIQGYWTWILPLDPIFEDYDRVMGYSVPQRLLREKQRDDFKGTTV